MFAPSPLPLPTCEAADAPGGVAVFETGTCASPDAVDARNAGRLRAPEHIDVHAFGALVRELADRIDPEPDAEGLARGRFGPSKVFIAAIRRALGETAYRDLPRQALDDLLLRAHRAGALQLARADLVSVMNADEVRDSEVVADGGIATFHFVVARPRNVAALELDSVSDVPFLPPPTANPLEESGPGAAHDVYLMQWRHLRDARGADRMQPPPGGPGTEQPIPRTTNADVIRLSEFWSRMLAGAPPVVGHDLIVARWTAAIRDVDRLARTGHPHAIYAKNNAYWRELGAVARQVAVAHEASRPQGRFVRVREVYPQRGRPETWTDAYRQLRNSAESMRGFLELEAGTPHPERWPRTTGADLVAIAALVDPHVRGLAADDALALRQRWRACMNTIGERALGALAETYPENRAAWACLARVFVHLASIDAPLPDPALWDVLVAELGHVLALRNVQVTEDGVAYRGAGPSGDAPFKPAFTARTYHELYLEQWKHLSSVRGTDRMKPPAGGVGTEQPIPRTTNADVILLSDYWSKQLAKVQKVINHDAIVTRWKAALAHIDQFARTGEPDAVYPMNNVYWRELAAVARQVSVADEAPTKWDHLLAAFKENVRKLPERVVDGVKTVGNAAVNVVGDLAHGVGKVANEAGKGLFSGFGTPLLIGAGALGVFLIARARGGDKEP